MSNKKREDKILYSKKRAIEERLDAYKHILLKEKRKASKHRIDWNDGGDHGFRD